MEVVADILTIGTINYFNNIYKICSRVFCDIHRFGAFAHGTLIVYKIWVFGANWKINMSARANKVFWFAEISKLLEIA